MESLSGCSSAVVTERLSTVTWGTRQPSIRASAILSAGVSGQSNAQLQGLYTIRNELQTIEARECPYRELKGEVLLGEGETFTVNRCDLEGKLVAVKHLKLGSWAANTPKFASRLHAVLMELRIMCYTHLRGHPNILSLLGYGWRHERQAILPYVVVDYSSHGTFRDFLQAGDTLDIYRKKRLVMDVACGLDALHSSGIIHGDLKLDNVLIFDRSGDPKAGRVAKICDFGHSLLLSAEDDDLVYRGTTIYNAPEVHKQAIKSISRAMLPRCDIWAFGLLALEVLVDGEVYRDHLGDEIYFDPTLIYDNPQIFCRELLKTAIQLSARIEQSFIKLFFQGLFRRTLMLKPQARTSHLCATLPPTHPPLQVPKKWEWSFDIFHPEQAKDYPWEQQKQIFHNFELSYQRGQRDPQTLAPAAFQLGLCYLVGFGVSVDSQIAKQYLSKAERCRHFVSLLIHPLLQDSTGQEHHQKLYTAAVVRGLVPQGAKTISLPIVTTLGNRAITFLNWSNFREQIKRLEQGGWVGSITNAKGRAGTQLNGSIRVNRRDLPAIQLTPHNWPKGPLNLLECAIMFRDVEIIKMIGGWYELQSAGVLGSIEDGWFPNPLPREDNPSFFIQDQLPSVLSEPLLVQGCRTGDSQIVRALLIIGASYRDTSADGCTVLHWLFMLGADAVPFADKHLKAMNFTELIDLPCTRALDLHKQWPFQLVGTPLAFSIWAGSLDAVTALLKLGANPIAPAFGESESLIDGVMWTHLHLAAMLHHVEILILLIAALDPRKKLDLSTSSIATVLCYSSKVERVAIHGRFTGTALQRTVAALEILDQNRLWRDDPVTLCEKFSPLATAIEFKDGDVAQALLKRHPHLATTPIRDLDDPSRYTFPAHLAVKMGSRHNVEDSVSMLEMLFHSNKDSFNTLDSSGNSPLHVAVTEYSKAIPQWILDHHPGSSLLNAVDLDGRTALHYCVSADTAELLLQREISVDYADQFGMTSLHCAALTGASEVMQVLIRWNANIDAIDNTSSSALHHSMTSGSSDAVHILLAHESNVHIQNIHGESPLHIVARRQRDDLVKALLDCGASTTLRNNNGLTPLNLAISLETSDPRKLIALCSRDTVSKCDEVGNNVVHTCVLLRRFDWLAYVKRLSSSADLCALNKSGKAPIHIAAEKLDAPTARVLLDDENLVNLTDSQGNTAIHIALSVQEVSEAERERFCALLASKGASFTKTNDYGQKPWYIAIKHQSEALMPIVFRLGGQQACYGIIYHNTMLQAAFGEKDIAKAIAYYDGAGLHRITPISRHQLAEISTNYAHSESLLLPLSFQDFEKQVYIPENTETSSNSEALPLSGLADLPEAIGVKIGPDDRVGFNTEKVFLDIFPKFPGIPADNGPSTRYDGILRGLKTAGKVTGGSFLAILSLPTLPILLPLLYWRRRMNRYVNVPVYSELSSRYELSGQDTRHELSSIPNEMKIYCNNEPTAKPTPAFSVDPDLLQFFVEQGIARLLEYAEQSEDKDDSNPETAAIYELDGCTNNDADNIQESYPSHSINAVAGSDIDISDTTSYTSGDLTSSRSTCGDDTDPTETASIRSTSGFSFSYGEDEIFAAKKKKVSLSEEDCGCAECIRKEFFRE